MRSPWRVFINFTLFFRLFFWRILFWHIMTSAILCRFRKLRNGSLLIRNAKPRDEAMYQCTAVNIGGESSEIIGLIVESKLYKKAILLDANNV